MCFMCIVLGERASELLKTSHQPLGFLYRVLGDFYASFGPSQGCQVAQLCQVSSSLRDIAGSPCIIPSSAAVAVAAAAVAVAAALRKPLFFPSFVPPAATLSVCLSVCA